MIKQNHSERRHVINKLSFQEIEISFINRYDGVRLSGTLSMPKSGNSHPCVILISGSGPQTRDQVVLGREIFKDVAYYFSNNGIAVLRFDDRGVGKSEGVFDDASLFDFRNDIVFAFYYLQELPEINRSLIGVLGHSIGGLLASMVEVELQHQLAFLISLAGPGMRGYELYNIQHELIARTQGAVDSEIDLMTSKNKKLCDLILKIENKKELMKDIKSLSLEEHNKKI